MADSGATDRKLLDLLLWPGVHTTPEPYPAPQMFQEIPILAYLTPNGPFLRVSERGRLALGLNGPDPEAKVLAGKRLL